MNESSITVRYAKALFQTALEENQLEVISADMVQLRTIIDESDEFKGLLVSPTLNESQKSKAIISVFKDKLHEYTVNFLLLLIKNKREMYLGDICRNFLSQHKHHMGIKEAVITTAIELEDKHKKEILDSVSRLFESKIDLKAEVDESVIGGFKLRVEDQLIDASISSKLQKIKQELINT